MEVEQHLHNQTDFLEEYLQAQREPFERLWSRRTQISDHVFLAPLRTHALRVLRVLGSLSNGGGRSPVWDGVYTNLHTAVSLRSLGLYIDVHGDSVMCGAAADHDDAMSRVKERFVAGQLVFQGAWNALELAGESLFFPRKKVTTQSLRHQLAKGGYRPIFGLREALFDAHRSAGEYIDTGHVAYREALASGNHLCVAAEQLRQFRNGILHGKIENMVPWDWGLNSKDETHEYQTELFHTQTRLVFFLLQAIIAKSEATHEMIWPNDDDRVEELIFGLQKEIPEDSANGHHESKQPSSLFAAQKYIEHI